MEGSYWALPSFRYIVYYVVYVAILLADTDTCDRADRRTSFGRWDSCLHLVWRVGYLDCDWGLVVDDIVICSPWSLTVCSGSVWIECDSDRCDDRDRYLRFLVPWKSESLGYFAFFGDEVFSPIV